MRSRTREAVRIAVVACFGLWIGGAQSARAEQPGAAPAACDAGAWLRQVAGDVQKLRLEILELRMEAQERRTAELERDLLSAQTERQRLEQEVAAHFQETVSLDAQIAEPGISAEQQQQLLARKSELLAETTGRLRTRQEALAGLETAVRERLVNQQRRLQESLARRSEIAPASAPTSNHN